MKRVDLQHEVTSMVGNHPDVFVITANCVPTEEEGIYDIKIVVKSKKRNRRRIHKGEIELNDPLAAIETVKEYMTCGEIVQGMIQTLSSILLNDFPEFYPVVDLE